MKLYDAITKDSILHEIDRICGLKNSNTYSLRDKIARVNAALDRYFHIVFKVDGRHNFDDIGETSPPIDTQNIVSGTNRYKFSDFTEKILGLIKLTVLDADGIEIELKREEIDELPDSFLQTYKSTITGTPDHYIKYGDFIYLRPYPDYSETDGLRAYFNRPLSKFDFATCTIANGADADVTAVAHGLAINDTVMFETDGALPTGLSVDTIYYLVATVATDTFNVATTKGGSSITTSSAGSGVHYFVEMSREPGILVVHHPYLARHAALPFLIEKSLKQMGQVMKQIGSDNPRDRFYGGDELAISEFFTHRDKEVRDVLKGRTNYYR